MFDIKNKIIFTHPQKTGGTTIESAFRWHPKYKTSKDINAYRSFFQMIKHASLSQHIFQLEKLGYNHKDFFKFTCVRNPWDAAVSFYLFFRKEKRQIAMSSFQDFLLEVCSDKDSFLNASFFYFHNGEYCIDYVIRYENYKEDAEKIFKKYGVDWNENFHTGIRPKNLCYKNFYNEFTKKIVENKANDLIKLFNYKF
jgi:hypothetical protein